MSVITKDLPEQALDFDPFAPTVYRLSYNQTFNVFTDGVLVVPDVMANEQDGITSGVVEDLIQARDGFVEATVQKRTYEERATAKKAYLAAFFACQFEEISSPEFPATPISAAEVIATELNLLSLFLEASDRRRQVTWLADRYGARRVVGEYMYWHRHKKTMSFHEAVQISWVDVAEEASRDTLDDLITVLVRGKRRLAVEQVVSLRQNIPRQKAELGVTLN